MPCTLCEIPSQKLPKIMLQKISKRRLTYVAPGRAFFEFTLDKHLTTLEENDFNDDNTVKPFVEKIRLSTFKFKNNCWQKFSLFIDETPIFDKILLQPFGIYDSTFNLKEYQFNFTFTLPWRPVKIKIELFQPNLMFKTDSITDVYLEYSDRVNLKNKNMDEIISIINGTKQIKNTGEEIDEVPSQMEMEHLIDGGLVYDENEFERRFTLDPEGPYEVSRLYIWC